MIIRFSNNTCLWEQMQIHSETNKRNRVGFLYCLLKISLVLETWTPILCLRKIQHLKLSQLAWWDWVAWNKVDHPKPAGMGDSEMPKGWSLGQVSLPQTPSQGTLWGEAAGNAWPALLQDAHPGRGETSQGAELVTSQGNCGDQDTHQGMGTPIFQRGQP